MASRLFANVSCGNIRQTFPLHTTRNFLDFIDSSVFEYLTTNADRKVHPIYKESIGPLRKQVMMLLDMDNGKR